MKRRVLMLVALAACSTVPYDSVAAQRRRPDPCATDTTRWHFSVTPYFWASGMKGDVGKRERTAHIDLSFRDIFDDLDGAFMLPAEISKGRIGLAGEVIYSKISVDRATAGRRFTGAEVEATQFIGELAPRIRVISNKKTQVDVLFGTRMWYIDSEVSLNAQRVELEADEKKLWWDRFAGARAFYNVAGNWMLEARGDVGGFESKTTWQAIGAVGYNLNRTFTVHAGYRHLDVDYVQGGNGLIYDVGISGPILGLTYRF